MILNISIDDISIDLSFSLSFYKETDDYPVEELTGIIKASVEDGDEVHDVNLGSIELHLYNAHNYHGDFGLWEAFQRSWNTNLLGEALLSNNDDFHDSVIETIGMNSLNSILVINDFFINPDYRYNGIGRMVIQGLREKFDGICGYIALQSFPKQHETIAKKNGIYSKYKLNLLNQDLETSRRSLDRFYESCGFRRISDKEHSFFIMNLEDEEEF